MAMYYYASKLSAVACGLRCKQQQRHRGRRKGSAPGATGMGSSSSGGEDEDEEVLSYRRRRRNGREGDVAVAGDELNLDEILHKKWNNQTVS